MISYDQYFSDINECDASPCDAATTTCVDNDGSFVCKCLDGFKPSSSPYSCDGKLCLYTVLIICSSVILALLALAS